MRRAGSSRRWFLRLLAGTALGSLVVRHLFRAGPRDELTACLVSILAGNDGARAIGAAFVRRFPEQAEVVALVDAVCGGSSLRPDMSAIDRAERVREVVRRRIRDDFETGRVLVLEEWVLSETEARLCALVALT